MNAWTIDHLHIYTDDIETTAAYYQQNFDASEIRRIQDGTNIIVHLALHGARLVISPCSDIHPKGLGHFAVSVDDLPEAIAKLRHSECDAFNIKRVDRFQNVFLKDPNGISIELISPSTK